jgi:putative ABC transport system permease protein
MGVAPQIGRAFTADEDRPGRGDVAVISEALWRSRFDADPGITKRAIQLNGRAHAVVGVMPASFAFPQTPAGAPDVWTPIAEPIQLYRGRHYLFVVARLREGVTRAQAQRDLDGIAARVAQEQPQFSRGHGVNVQPLHGELIQGVRRALLVLFAGVALVLVIGCCNVANLLLSRAAARQQEIAIRVALGADRWRIARQLLAEGSLLAAVGGAGGLLLAAWLIAVAKAAVPADVPRLQDASLDGTAAAFAALVSAATAVIFGLVPLAQAMRVHVADRLKHGAKGTARPARQPMRRALVIAEVALTMIVATGAAFLLQSVNRLLHVDPGFRTDGIVAADVALPPSRYRTAAAQRAFIDTALARLESLPGVSGAAATNAVPHGNASSGVAVAIEGRPALPPGQELTASYRIVTPGYFATLDIPVLSGRGFTAQDARVSVPLIRWFAQQPRPDGFDRPQAIPVAVVNETMARQYWPGLEAIGRRFTVLYSPPITVIGIVRDARNRALADAPGPEFYLTNAQEPQGKMTLLVRARDARPLPAALRAHVSSIDRDLPVSNVRTLAEVVDGNLALLRAITALMGAFAAMALLLMMLGVYAVVSYATAQRTYEIGVRLALGAQRRDIRRLVVGHGVGLAVAGIAIGGGGAYALARFASNMLYEIAPSDPLTHAGLATLVLAITMLATWLPARRAQRVDPVAVLRNE